MDLASDRFQYIPHTMKKLHEGGELKIVMLGDSITAGYGLSLAQAWPALLQQKIAPELKAINKRYEGLKLTDPRQHDKQKEIQEVMKRENINQFGGCLPTIIQLPFLFAFYSMLSTVNELRHAHWLWINDLSSPDPWHILPVAIVISMFVMQRATPMTGMDESQARMMQVMMPLMIGGISWSLPAGLGVYWVTGNIIGYLLQMAMNNTKTAREIRAHLAKRAAKKGK